MISNDFFTIEIDTDIGSASIKETEKFKNLDVLLKADLLRDLKYDMEKSYDRAVTELDKYIKEYRLQEKKL
tara:strand:- start:1 stop:213 length:213 start_codon:yes stop_codon:yes gene_type:complete